MKRVKFFVIIGTLIFVTSTSIAASRKEKSEAEPLSKSETKADTKSKSKKVRCWNSITTRNAKQGKTVFYCGTCEELPGRRTLFSRGKRVTIEEIKNASR